MDEIRRALLDLLARPIEGPEAFEVGEFSGNYTYRLTPEQMVYFEELCRVSVVRIIDNIPHTGEFVIQEGRDYFQVNTPDRKTIKLSTVAEVIDHIRNFKDFAG